MQLTLDLTENEAEILLKAIRNEAERDRAYRPIGVSAILDRVAAAIETAGKKPIQSETPAANKKQKRA